MSEKSDVFRRYEKKYRIDRRTMKQLMEQFADKTVADQFGHYTIRNIYFDTDNYAIIRRSIEKPVYKEKLRLRCYGDINQSGKIYLELKKKFKREVFKRRVSMSAGELDRYLEDKARPEGSQQILQEIEYFLSYYKPHPKIFIAYDRTALSGLEDTNLRITFDENIRFRTQDLNLQAGANGQQILGCDQILMEIKIPGVMPLWLCQVLCRLEIYPISFSKVGYCYQNHICESMPKTILSNQSSQLVAVS